MPNIEIRTARQTDLNLLANLDHNYLTAYVWQMDRDFENERFGVNFHEIRLPRAVSVDYPRTLEFLTPENSDQQILLAACLEGEAIAYARLKQNISPRTTWISDLAVSSEIRRQGVASALILASQDWAAEKGQKQVIIEMQSKNFPAICLAQKMGYELCGYNDHYYANQDIVLFFVRSLR